VSDTTRDAVPTVLVVDDDPWILELVKDMLATEPCRVVTTTEPVKALPLMEWERACVLVADIAMPEVDGIDLVVRARKLFPAVPRILLTAAPTLERVIRSVNEAEIFRVLVKPVSPKVLRETIREALQRSLEGRADEGSQSGSREREEKLFALSKAHPGIGTVELSGGRYLLAPERMRDLEERFRSSPLAGLLRAPSGGTAPH
jgi:DNA-binding NtrC family response regulator